MKKQTWLVLLLVLALVFTTGLLQACTTTTYTITFKADGAVVDTVTVEKGQAVTYPDVPVKDGYTGVWDPASITAASEDTTVTAVYTPVAATTYTVTFVADGTTVNTVTVNEGEGVAASSFPTVPAKEGYRGAWEVDSISSVTANMTVNAVYTAINSVTFAFDTDGGNEMNSLQIEIGAVAAVPANPVKAGYTFGGWYADAAMNNLYDFTAAVTADTTIYAAWTINEYTVTLPSDYQNTTNYVSFTDFDASADVIHMFYTIDGGDNYVEMEDGDAVPYGAVVYFQISSEDVNKTAVAYANGTLLKNYTNGSTPFGPNGTEIGGTADYCKVTVTENVVITARAAYVVIFDANEGEFDDAATILAVVNNEGSVAMPAEVPTKTGYHFVGWSTAADDDDLDNEFENSLLIESDTVYAIYAKNTYTVSASTDLANVTLELGASSALYDTTVGLRVIDSRTTGSVPLLVRVNGEVLGHGETDSVMGTGITDKVFNVPITENTVITVTAEYRYQFVTFNYGDVSNLKYFKEDVNADFFTTHVDDASTGEITATDTDSDVYLAAGDTISFYVKVAEGYKVSLNTANPDVVAYWAMEPATAGAEIAGVNTADRYFPALDEGDDMTNKFLVTVTLPAPVATNATYNVYLASSFTVTADTYTVNGMNVANDNYMLKQGSVATTASGDTVTFGITATTEFNVNTRLSYDPMYKNNIVFVKLNESKNYYVTMNGQLIFDTLNVDTNATWTDGNGVEHDVWVIDAAEADIVDLYDALCDQNWEVVEYKTVTVKLNGDDYDTNMGAGDVRQIEVGTIWYATISNAFVVKINGAVQTGTVGTTDTTYRYQVTTDTTVELIQKFNVSLERPSGTEDATVTNMTVSCLYGDIVTATITPAGTYDKIMVVKAVDADNNVYMLSGDANVYTYTAGVDNGKVYTAYDTHDIQVLTVKYEFTDQYIIVVYDEEDEASNALAPVNGLLGTYDDTTDTLIDTWLGSAADSYLSDPTLTGSIFKGWQRMVWNDSAYENDGNGVRTLAALITANQQFTGLDVDNTHPDRLVAVYDRVKPVVIFADEIGLAYTIDTVKVDNSTIYFNDTNWVTYSDTMQNTGYGLDYDKEVVFTLKEDLTKILTGYTLKVFVGTTEITANANGEYVLDLSDFEYSVYNENIVVRVVYAATPVAFAQTFTDEYTWTFGSSAYDSGDLAAADGTNVVNMSATEVSTAISGHTPTYFKIATVTGAANATSTPDMYFAIPSTATQVSYKGASAVELTSDDFDNGLFLFAGQSLGTAAITGNYVYTIEFLDADNATVAVYVIVVAADVTP